MGGLLGDLWVRFKGDNRQLMSTIRQNNAAIGQFNRQVGSSSTVLGRMSSGAERAWSTMVSWTKRAALGLGAVVSAIGTLAVKGGIERLLGLENADRRLRSLGVSATDTGRLMKFLNDTLIGTAFSLDEGAQAITGFVASGLSINEVEKRFRLMADTAAFAQVPLQDISVVFDQIQNKGKAYTGELQMLAQRGVPVFQILAAGARKSIPQITEMLGEGAISSQEFFDLYAKGAQRFGENNVSLIGSAKNMGETTSGAWANMRTAMSRTAAELLSGIFPSIRAGLLELTAWFNEFGERVGPAFDMLWRAVRANAGDMGAALRGIGDVVIDVVVNDVIPAIRAMLPVMVQATQLVADLGRAFTLLPQPIRTGIVALVAFGVPLLGVVGGLIKLSRVLAPVTGGLGAFLALLIRVRSVADLSALLSTTVGGFAALNPVILAVVAALGLAYIGWRNYRAAAKFAQETTEDVTEALRLDSGALGVNTREATKNALARKDLIARSSELGLNLTDVVDAALGEEDALRRVVAQLRNNEAGAHGASDAINGLTQREIQFLGALGLTRDQIERAIGSYKRWNFEQVEFVRVGNQALPTLSKLRAENEHQAYAGLHAADAAKVQKNAVDALRISLDQLSQSTQDSLAGMMTWTQPLAGYQDALAAANEATKAGAETRTAAAKADTKAAQAAVENQRWYGQQMADAVRERNKAVAEAERDHAAKIADVRRQYHQDILAAERTLSEAIVAANQERHDRLLQLEREASEERAKVIQDRANDLFSGLELEIDLERKLGLSIQAVTRSVVDQNRQLVQWLNGLDKLRAKGLSEAAISALQLDQFSAQSLALVRNWSHATQGEIDRLNSAIAKRQKIAREQANKEAQQMLGVVGDALREIARKTAAETREINRDHAQAIAEANKTYAESMVEAHRRMREGIAEANRGLQQALQGVAEQFREAVNGIRRELRRKNQAEALSADSTAAMYGEMTDSFDVYMSSLNKRLSDMRAWHRNLNRIRQAAGDEYADMLMAQGMEQAGLVAEIAKQTNDKIRQAARTERTIRVESAREGLKLLQRTGALRVTQTSKLTREEVNALAAKLGVAPKIVQRIFNQMKEEQRQKLNRMIRNSGLGGTHIANQLGKMLDQGQMSVFKIMKQYSRALARGLNPIIKAIDGKPIVFSSAERAHRVFQALAPGRNPGIQANAGGPVPGVGPDRDSVPAMLTPGEHVWTRTEVQRAGGHRAMERMRERALRGQLLHRRMGGPVTDTEGYGTLGPERELGREAELRRLAHLGAQGLQSGGKVTGLLKGLKPGFLLRLRTYAGAIKTALRVVSGFRTQAQQAYLYATKPGLAAPPGRSLHQLGIAADLSPQLGGTAKGNPVSRRFGLEYPMSYEPWHIQLMDAAAALLPSLKLPPIPNFPQGGVGRTAKQAVQYVVKQVRAWYDKLTATYGGVGGAAPGGGPVRKIVQTIAQQFGWGSGGQWAALSQLVSHESSWRPTAQNPTSSAYGLFQFLDSTWGGTGIGKTSDPTRQTIAGLRYIKSRYGTPLAAWNFWQRNRWYDEGGLLQPGTTVATNNTGAAEIIAAQGMIADEVSAGITEALTGNLPNISTALGVGLNRMTVDEYEKTVARWQLAWEFGITSTEDRLHQLRRLMLRALPWSDEWVALFRERQEIVQNLLDEAVAGVEEALARQAEAFDNLNQLLDARTDALRRISDAQLAFEERRSDLIEARADSLARAFDPQQRLERVWANSIGSVTRNIQSQIEAFTQWAEGLDFLRAMGLSEEAIAALGLEDMTAESLATVQLWSNATQGEIDALNTAIAQRQSAATDQATAEANRMMGELGRELLALTQETADEIAQLQIELAEIGMDTGRGYAEALAEGLTSGIPGIVAAAEAAQEAIAGVNEAEAALSQARDIAQAEPAAGTGYSSATAPTGRLVKTPDAGWYVRFSGPPAQWARVGEQAVKHARTLWGPQIAYPNNKPKTWAEGKWIKSVLGDSWWKTYTKPNAAPKSALPGFAMGGNIMGRTTFGLGGGLGVAGEHGQPERVTITPLSRDMTTPHEQRLEAALTRQERILDRIADAAERGDGTIVLDTGVLAGAVTARQRRITRREQVAAGTATRWRQL